MSETIDIWTDLPEEIAVCEDESAPEGYKLLAIIRDVEADDGFWCVHLPSEAELEKIGMDDALPTWQAILDQELFVVRDDDSVFRGLAWPRQIEND